MLVLMRVSTYYQLINAINIKISLLKGQEVDLVLNQSSDFSEIGKKVEESGCFRKVFYSPDSLEDDNEFWKKPKEDRRRISLDPASVVYDIGLMDHYTDLYLPIEDAYNKLFYYDLLRRGMTPKIHMYEEGLASYTLDMYQRANRDGMDHKRYGEKGFLNSIEEFLLYGPELFSAPRRRFGLNALPKIDPEDVEVRNIFKGIFGEARMPEEPVIFFMEAWHADRITSSDMQIVQELADIFGAENIILKMHPRDTENWIETKGYKIFPESKIPWEIMCMLNDIEDKLFVSLSSTAVISHQMIFGKRAAAMHIYKLKNYGGSLLVRQKGADEYYKKLYQLLNQDEQMFFIPRDTTQLREIGLYLKAKGRI